MKWLAFAALIVACEATGPRSIKDDAAIPEVFCENDQVVAGDQNYVREGVSISEVCEGCRVVLVGPTDVTPGAFYVRMSGGQFVSAEFLDSGRAQAVYRGGGLSDLTSGAAVQVENCPGEFDSRIEIDESPDWLTVDIRMQNLHAEGVCPGPALSGTLRVCARVSKENHEIVRTP